MRLCATYEEQQEQARQQRARFGRVAERPAREPRQSPPSLLPPLPPCQTCGEPSSPITPTGYAFCVRHAVAHYHAQAEGHEAYVAHVLTRACRRCGQDFLLTMPVRNDRKRLCGDCRRAVCRETRQARPTR